jgi:hypothetical protein
MINVERPSKDIAGEVARAADALVDRLDAASYEIADRLDSVSHELADHANTFGAHLGDVRARLGKSVRRIGDAMSDLGKSAERPGSRVVRSFEDFAREVRQSYDRLTGRRPRSRLAFWR